MAKGSKPKKIQKENFTEVEREMDQGDLECSRKREKQAKRLGLIQTTKPELPKEVLRVPRSLQEGCNGAPIANKPRGKSSKVLMIFPMTLKPTSFGILGKLA